MGGSSLAPEVLWRTFGAADDALALHVLDSTDPAAILAVQEQIDLERTLFVVSTKSGGTIETLSLFEHFHSLVGDGSRFIAITDPGSSLLELAREHGFRRSFENDPNIGGRYSALSLFGLVPAALIGAPVHALLERAAAGRAGVRALRQHPEQPGPVARPGDRRARASRARQAHLRRLASRSRASGCGSSSWSPRAPASTAAGSCRSPMSRCSSRTPTAAIASSSTCATRTRGAPRSTRRSRRSAPPGTRPSRSATTAARTSGGSSSSPSSRPRSRAGCSRSTPSTSPTSRRPRTRPRRCSRPARCRRWSSPPTTRCARCWAAPRAGSYIAVMGYVAPSLEFDEEVARAARDARREDAACDAPSGTARASSIPPASCTRAARRSGASCR